MSELSRELLCPQDVPRRCPEIANTDEVRRWDVLDRLAVDYASWLASQGLVDTHMEHMRVLNANGSLSPEAIRSIVLVGVVELDGAARKAIEMFAGDVAALAFLPEERSADMDAIGCLRSDLPPRPVPIEDSQLEFAGDIADAAARAIGRIAGWSQQEEIAPTDVCVCAPEAGIAGALKVACEDVPGLQFHDAAGEPMGCHRLTKLLSALKEYWRARTAESLLGLAKRPEVERFVTGEVEAGGGPGLGWVSELDALAIMSPAAEPRALGGLAQKIDQIVVQIAAPCEGKHPLVEHLRVVRQFLVRLVGGDDASDPEASQVLAGAIEELEQASGVSDSVPGHDAIEFLLALLGKAHYAPQRRRDEVELLGWLEAAVDHSRYFVLVGLNDGFVPGAARPDSMLPEPVRRALGLPDARRRALRDAHLLEGLIRWRRGGVWFLTIGQDDEGNPLKPSRFLFACEDERAIVRAARLTAEPPEPPKFQLSSEAPPPVADRQAFPIAPMHAVALPDKLHPTAIRTYLESPYVFFLRHVARVDQIEEDAGEIGSHEAGSVIHAVLKSFGDSRVAGSADANEIASFVHEEFETRLSQLPSKKVGAIREVQIELIRRRLASFAALQALHSAEGWKIAKTEWSPKQEVILEVPEGRVRLIGRIDRIDRGGGKTLILDYKTGDKREKPESRHMRNDIWYDLQLPLYAYLAKQSGEFTDDIQVGYFQLPCKPEEAGVQIAEWTPDELEDGLGAAKRVVSSILKGEFGLGKPGRAGGAIARLCGLTIVEIGEEGES
ncbi:MAG: PD-(D/E)XK nuclease family protein [Phycisphaerales bacterium]|nr:PD-(D/E)XK nuclease family protein [Planctomycetota bacterium]